MRSLRPKYRRMRSPRRGDGLGGRLLGRGRLELGEHQDGAHLPVVAPGDRHDVAVAVLGRRPARPDRVVGLGPGAVVPERDHRQLAELDRWSCEVILRIPATSSVGVLSSCWTRLQAFLFSYRPKLAVL